MRNDQGQYDGTYWPVNRLPSLYVCGRCGFQARVPQTWVFERVAHECSVAVAA